MISSGLRYWAPFYLIYFREGNGSNKVYSDKVLSRSDGEIWRIIMGFLVPCVTVDRSFSLSMRCSKLTADAEC
ncbi:hypothetical protein BVI1335_1650046 [Burkholderia vietnamiensis]|nr:hypothetical protein BVI1335_1650046 [Burkholderia vietnamiensis]